MFEFVCLNFARFCFDPNKTHTRKFRGSTGLLARRSRVLFLHFLDCLGHETSHSLCGILLHLPGHVGVGVQREARAVVTQDAGYRLGIYSLLDGQGREGVPLWHNKDLRSRCFSMYIPICIVAKSQ